MLTIEQIKNEAVRLHTAEQERQQIRATTSAFPEMEIEDAYKIQSEWMDIKKAEGRSVVGHKIGLTSKTMQRAMNISEPDYGCLLDDMVFEPDSKIDSTQFLDPRIEVELAFVLKHKLEGADLTIEDVLKATDYIVPALEIIAARSFRVNPVSGYRRGVRDSISDNAANAGIVLGSQHFKPDELDLRWVGAIMSKNGDVEETGLAAGVLNHPAFGIVWLARKYAQYNIALEPGQIILSGSFTRPVPIGKGDVIDADFGSAGQIKCYF